MNLVAMRSALPILDSMNYAIQRIAAQTRLDIPIESLTHSQSGDRLLVVSCGAGSTITVPHGFAGLWCPIRGRALVLTADSRMSFGRRSIFVSDSLRSEEIAIQPCSAAIGLIASQAVWSSVVSIFDAVASPEPVLFPAMHSVNLSVCAQLIRVVRALLESAGGVMEVSNVMNLATVINDLQRPFAQLIARCPGRNSARRRIVFMRLQRIRTHLSCCTQPDLDVRKLALTANYSVWRFIRVYYCVFGETPYAYISRCRITRARELLETGEQCVGDIAQAVGLKNSSTLTRAMKKRYGVSTAQLRLNTEAACAGTAS